MGILNPSSPAQGVVAPRGTVVEPTVTEQPTTPTTEDLAEGTLEVNGGGAYFTPPATPSSGGGGILEGDMGSEIAEGGPLTSAETLTEMLSKDSSYMKAAETRGLQEANKRGILNSSMAIGAVEKERIEAAAPFAQQDAKFRQDAALNYENIKNQGLVDANLIDKEGAIQMNLERLKASSNEKIASITGANQIAAIEAQGVVNERLAQIEGDMKAELYKLQGEISAGLNEQEAGFRLEEIQATANSEMEKLNREIEFKQEELAFEEKKLAADTGFKELELDAKMWVEEQRLSQENTEMFNTTMNSIQEDYMNDYMTIMADPNFESWQDRQQAIDVLNQGTRARIEIAAGIAGADISFVEEGEEGEEGEETTPPAYTPGSTTPAFHFDNQWDQR